MNDSTLVNDAAQMLRGMASFSVTHEQRHLLFVVDACSSSSSGNHALPPQICGPVCCMEHPPQQPDQLSISVLGTHVDVEEAAGHEHASSQPCSDTADTGSHVPPAHLTLKQLAALAASLCDSSGRAQAWKTVTAVVCSTSEACVRGWDYDSRSTRKAVQSAGIHERNRARVIAAGHGGVRQGPHARTAGMDGLKSTPALSMLSPPSAWS